MAKVKEEKEAKSKHQEILDKMNSLYGAGTVMQGRGQLNDLVPVSTGCLGLDLITGINGLPLGRIVEVIGPESSGKTTLYLETMANAQKQGLLCAIVDMEHALSGEYMESLGIDMDKIIISQPSWGEQALDVAINLIKGGEVKVIAIDSVAALVPKAELEGTAGDQKPGLQARMMGQALRMITASAEEHGCLVIFVNQLREKIGVMFGSPETTSGGNALRFFASIRIDIRKTPKTDGQLNETRIKLIKNKVGKPFGTCQVDILWGTGFDKEGELLTLAVDYKIIDKSGSWFSYGESKIGQGFDAVKVFMQDNPEVMSEIKFKVIQKINELNGK